MAPHNYELPRLDAATPLPSLPQEILDIIIMYAVMPTTFRDSTYVLGPSAILFEAPTFCGEHLAQVLELNKADVVLQRFTINKAIYRQAKREFVRSRGWSQKIIVELSSSVLIQTSGRRTKDSSQAYGNLKPTPSVPFGRFLQRLRLDFKAHTLRDLEAMAECIQTTVQQASAALPDLQEMMLRTDYCAHMHQRSSPTKSLWRSAVETTIESLRKPDLMRRYLSMDVLRCCGRRRYMVYATQGMGDAVLERAPGFLNCTHLSSENAMARITDSYFLLGDYWQI